MTTATLTQQSAIAALDDAKAQHELLAAQFSQLQTQLSKAEPGTTAFTSLANRAATLKGKLQQLTTEIALLTPLAKGEAKRREEEAAAAVAAQAALEAQLAQDELDIDAAITAINELSDKLATALEAYFETYLPAKIRLQESRRRKFSEMSYNSQLDRVRLPYIRISGTSANRCTRANKDRP